MWISIILILISPLRIAYSQYLIVKRIKDMPRILATESAVIASREKHWAKMWRDRHYESLKEIEKLNEELLATVDKEADESNSKSKDDDCKFKL